MYAHMDDYKFLNVAAAATTAVKASPGRLSHIVINGGTLTGTITIYDSLSASGTKVATIGANQTNAGIYVYRCMCSVGITIVATANVDYTVVYK